MLVSGPRGGADRSRTGDLRLARAALSQLSYSPNASAGHRAVLVKANPIGDPSLVGLSGFEPLTSRLSGVRSHQLSYRPVILNCKEQEMILSKPNRKEYL